MPHGAAGQPRPFQVTPARRTHILDGDATGGGHGPGRSVSGKSEFPPILTDDEIIAGIEAIANDPSSYPGGLFPVGNRRVRIQGDVRGTTTMVIVDPASREVVTAYPRGVARNP